MTLRPPLAAGAADLPAGGVETGIWAKRPNSEGNVAGLETNGTLLVDRSTLFREGLRTFLAGTRYPAMAEADELKEAIVLVRQGLAPGIIILDFAEGNAHHLKAVREVRRLHPAGKIVLLANQLTATKLIQALDSGIDACLARTISADTLLTYLDLVAAGERVLPVDLVRLLIAGNPDGGPAKGPLSPAGLTAREIEILGGLINGEPNKTIALRLGITDSTVKVHVKGLLRKINVANRTQAAIWALNNGLERQRPETVFN